MSIALDERGLGTRRFQVVRTVSTMIITHALTRITSL